MEERKGGHITSLKKTHLSLSPSVGLGLEGGSVEDFYADKHKPNQTNPTPSTTHHYKALLSTFFLHPFALFLKRKVFSPLSLFLSLYSSFSFSSISKLAIEMKPKNRRIMVRLINWLIPTATFPCFCWILWFDLVLFCGYWWNCRELEGQWKRKVRRRWRASGRHGCALSSKQASSFNASSMLIPTAVNATCTAWTAWMEPSAPFASTSTKITALFRSFPPSLQ